MAGEYAKLEMSWPSPTVGTGPFKTGFHFVCANGSEDLSDVVDAVQDWWADGAAVFKGYLASDLGVGAIKAQGEFAGIMLEYEGQELTVPTGLAAELPGVSFRVKKVAGRPAKGRAGSMFWPLAENTAHNGAGVLQGNAQVDISAGCEAMRAAVESVTGCAIVQRHQILEGTPTWFQVTDMQCFPTVSYLQRRYR